MKIDESILLQKRYFCPVCVTSGFTFDKPEMSKTRGVIISPKPMGIRDNEINSSYPTITYYDIFCNGCGFNFRVEV